MNHKQKAQAYDARSIKLQIFSFSSALLLPISSLPCYVDLFCYGHSFESSTLFIPFSLNRADSPLLTGHTFLATACAPSQVSRAFPMTFVAPSLP